MFPRDLRFALRSLRRSPGFALAAIVTLALGIGANSAVFSLIHGVLLEPLPYRQGEDLVVLRQQTADVDNVPFSIAEFTDYRQRARHLRLVEYHAMSFTLLSEGAPRWVSTGVVSHDFFDVLGVGAAEGRLFRAADEAQGAEAVLILSDAFWRSAFGADPGIVGRVFQMNDKPHTVVGVLPPIPQFPSEHDVYMPTTACPFRAAGQQAMHENRGAFRALTVFGRLLDGAGIDTARREAAALASSFVAEHPATYDNAAGFGAQVHALQDELTREARPMLFLLVATAALVLLLACLNVANLSLARLLRRRRELAVRASLGAGRLQIVRQLSAESLLVALGGGACGLVLAWAGLDMLRAFTARFTPRALGIELDGMVLVFTLVLAVVASLLAGVVPALAQRVVLQRVVHETARASEDARSLRSRGTLVVLQVAASVVLLVAAGLFVRSMHELQQVDPGFEPENVVGAMVPLNWTKYSQMEQRVDFFERLLAELDGHPGVVSAAVGSVTPLAQSGGMVQNFRLEGEAPADGVMPSLDLQFVGGEYFRTLGIPLVRGRLFDSRDHAEAPAVAVISRSLAERHWPGRDPLGRRVSFDDGESWIEVVGIVGDVRQYGLDQPATEGLYRPMPQTGGSNQVFVRARSATPAMAQVLRDAVVAIDPEQPIDRVMPLERTRADSLSTPRLSALLLSFFAALALAVTTAGVGSVMAWSVSRRTREIGVRMALGARAGSVLSMVLRQGLTLVAVGLVLGLVAALAAGPLLSRYLFGVASYDPLTLAGVIAVLALAATVACGLPALRAVRIDPATALRRD
ncbi:MAG: ABC transporter permease [Acidobacteriota bacterium]